MKFRITGNETLGLNMKKRKILGGITLNYLEIIKFRKISKFTNFND